jgi:hypothetical protein
MNFEKLITVTVGVPNPINFCANKHAHLMKILRNTYEGVCYMGVFILSIKEITNTSEVVLSTTNNSGEGVVYVEFIANAAIVSNWDILVGVTVADNKQMVVGLYTGNASEARTGSASCVRAAVTLLPMPSKALESLAAGQKIAVRVLRRSHEPMSNFVSVVAALLTCDQAAPVYRLRGSLNNTASAELVPLLASINDELKLRDALIGTHKASLWFFEQLLYAYKRTSPASDADAADSSADTWLGGPMWQGPAAFCPLEEGSEVVNILGIARAATSGISVPVSGLWSRSLALHRSSPLGARALENASPLWAAAVDATPREVFATFTKNILDFLTATRELAVLFANQTDVEKHFNVWLAMRAAQKFWPPTA